MPSAFRRAGRSRVAPSASANDASSSSTSASPLSSPLVSKQRQQQQQQEQQQEQFSSSSSSASMLRGVKPWQGGSYRTSVGLNDLDAILGGGQVLGTTVFLEEDRLWTRDLAHTLVRYWCAEALSQEQQLLAPVVQCTNDNESGSDDDDDPSSLPSWLKEDGFGFEDGDYLSNHRLLREELHHLLLSLPRNLHWDKQKKRAENKAKQEEKAKQEAAASSLSGGLGSLSLEPMAILEEDEEEDDNDNNNDNNDNDESKNKADADADDGLKVAWQYKTSVQQERLAKARSEMSSSSSLSSSSSSLSSFATTDVFCHSYDLSGRMNDQNPIDPSRHVSTLSLKRPITGSSNNTTTTTKNNYNNNGGGGGHGHHARGYRLFSQLVRLLTTESSSIAKASLSASASGHHPTRAVRLLLYRPPLDLLAVALPLLVAHIREKSLPVVLLVCATPNANANADDLRWKLAISRSCDVVLSTEGFAARHEFPPPAEFRHLKGVLKIARVDSKTRKRTELQASIYGFQRDRRKLHVPLLHIPPEDYAEGGGSVSGGVRSGAGRPLGYYDEGSGDSSNNSNSRPKPRGGVVGGGMGCSSNFSGSLLDF